MCIILLNLSLIAVCVHEEKKELDREFYEISFCRLAESSSEKDFLKVLTDECVKALNKCAKRGNSAIWKERGGSQVVNLGVIWERAAAAKAANWE